MKQTLYVLLWLIHDKRGEYKLHSYLPKHEVEAIVRAFYPSIAAFFETEEGLTIVDFKTDHVRTEEEQNARVKRYRPQIEAYSAALETVFEKKVTRRILYFLHTGQTVEV